LASFWGGIPKWYIHTMGLGKNIGFGTVESFNNTTFYFDGGFNGSGNSVHMALMGDPSLCNRHLPAVKGLTATSVNKRVSLKWNKPKGDFDGYAVYRVDTTKNIYIKATPYIIKDTLYTDSSNYVGGDYTYFVYTIKKETTASGSYYNIGGASKAFVKHSNNLQANTKNNVQFYPNPSSGIVKFNQESLHSFMIYDRTGKSFSINKTDDMSINIEHLPEGIYILRCLDENDLEISVPIIKLAN
jgi:hypothetical protein